MNAAIAQELPLPPGPALIATGAWFKNSVCAARGASAALSHPVGDLDSPQACLAHERALEALLAWLDAGGASPAAVACDLHPDFHSSRVARELAQRLALPLIEIQHHHAHVAAVCAEQGFDGAVIGLALDGVGLGSDGQAWGGELLRVERGCSIRIGWLRPLPLPGGDVAAREPWRMAAAVLHSAGRGDEIERRFPDRPKGLARLLESKLRCPETSSLGRVFDAAAGLLGICEVMRFEAEAAIALERAAAAHGPCAPMDGGWHVVAGRDGLVLDLLPVLEALSGERDVGRGAARFHATLAAALADWLRQAARREGLNVVAAGGGCLHNQLLAAALRGHCRSAGIELLEARRLSPGDAAISFGQVSVARRILEEA